MPWPRRSGGSPEPRPEPLPSQPLAAVRIRPWLSHEDGPQVTIKPATRPAPAVELRSEGHTPLVFPSHFVFTEEETQALLYKDFLSQTVREVMDSGRGSTVISCGPPGSGKSHSLLGYGMDPGLIPHATFEIFRYASSSARQVKVWCSFLEVHNDDLVDLLAPLPAKQSKASGLEVVELQGPSVHVLGLTESLVESVKQVQQLVDYGNKKRSASSKLLGVHGYSHTVFSLLVGDDQRSPAGQPPRRSRLAFVDCASYNGFKDASLHGLSEALKDMALGGPRARGLGKAFFRRSSLTQLLEDALSCKERLLLLATVSPGQSFSEAAPYLEMVKAAVDAASIIGRSSAGQGEELLKAGLGSHHSSLLLNLEIEALQSHIRHGSRPGREMAQKETRLLALQRVLAELSERAASAEEQVAATKSLMQAQLDSLKHWGFASDEDLSSAAAYLLRLHSDPMLTGCLAYAVGPYGSQILGSVTSPSVQGLGVASEHCEIFDTGGGLWIKNMAPGRYRLSVNGKILDGCAPEPLQHGDRLQVGWALELLVVSDVDAELCLEVREDLVTRPLAALIDEANELVKELDDRQIASKEHKFFEVVDQSPSRQFAGYAEETLVRLRHQSQAAEDAVTLWPVSDFRMEVKRMRDLFRSPSPKQKDKVPCTTLVEDDSPQLLRTPSPSAKLQDIPASPSKPELWREVVRQASVASSAASPKDERSLLTSLQRAQSLSQSIGQTVCALQETVAELKRTAASAVPMEVAKLREDSAQMKRRLERLERLEGQVRLKEPSTLTESGPLDRHQPQALGGSTGRRVATPLWQHPALPTARRHSMPSRVTRPGQALAPCQAPQDFSRPPKASPVPARMPVEFVRGGVISHQRWQSPPVTWAKGALQAAPTTRAGSVGSVGSVSAVRRASTPCNMHGVPSHRWAVRVGQSYQGYQSYPGPFAEPLTDNLQLSPSAKV